MSANNVYYKEDVFLARFVENLRDKNPAERIYALARVPQPTRFKIETALKSVRKRKVKA